MFKNNYFHAETDGALIYYTVNGTKPDPFQKIGDKFTYRYYKPFVLGPGKRTVKAMATSRFVFPINCAKYFCDDLLVSYMLFHCLCFFYFVLSVCSVNLCFVTCKMICGCCNWFWSDVLDCLLCTLKFEKMIKRQNIDNEWP